MPGGKIDILVEPDLRAFPGKLQSGLQASTGIAGTAGRGIATALGVGLLGAGAAFKTIIDKTVEFQGNLNSLQAVTGATGAEMEAVSAKATQLGNDITLPGTSASTAAAAMLELAKGGLTVQQAMDAAKGTLTLAAAAQVDGAKAAQIQSDALNIFQLKATDASRVADILANSANASAVEITDVAESMKYVGPVASAAGISIEDTATAIALLGNNGIRGSEAGTSLRGMLAGLVAPSKESGKALGELGVNAFDSQGKFVGFEAVIDQLRVAQGRLTQEQFQGAVATAFGRETMSGVLALVNQAPDAYDKMREAVTKQGGAQEVAAAKMKGLGGAIEAFKGQVETNAIQIGTALAPALESVVRGGTGVLSTLTDAASGVGSLTDRFPGLNRVLDVGKELWSDFTTILGNARDAAGPVVEGLDALTSSAGEGDGVVALFADGLELVGSAAVGASQLLGPIGTILGGILEVAADLPAPLQAAALAFLAFKTVPDIVSALRGESDQAAASTGRLGRAVDAVTAPARGATAGLRQFRDEMRLQQSLAAASGESLSRLGAAQAAFETSTVGAVAAVRSFRDDVRTLQAAADGAGRPISGLEAAVGALAQRSPAVSAVATSFDVVSSSVRAFGDTAGAAADRATVALGDRLAGGAQRGTNALLAIPGAARGAASALSTGLQVALIRTGLELEALPARVRSGASTLTTGLGVAALDARAKLGQLAAGARDTASTVQTALGVAALDAAEKVRQLPAAAASAASTLRTAVGVAAIDTGTKLRSLGTSAVDSGRALSTGLQTAVIRAGLELQALPAAAVSAGARLVSSTRDAATGAGRALVDGLRTAGSTGASALGDGLRAVPGVVRGAFEKVGSAVDVGISAIGRFTGVVAGAGASLGTGLLKGAGSLVSFLGGPWGIALAGAGIALDLLGQHQQDAAQKAQEHQATLDRLAGTLDKYSGAVTQATVNEQAGILAKDGTLAKVKELGISTEAYVRATLGVPGALEQVNGQLFTNAQALINSGQGADTASFLMQRLGISLNDITGYALGLKPGTDAVYNGLLQVNDQAERDSLQAMLDGLASRAAVPAELAKALGITNGELAKIQEQSKLASEASNDFAAKLDFLKQGLGGLAAGAPQTEVLRQGFAGLATSAGQAAQSAGEAAAKIGGVAAGGQAAAAAMQQSRDAFVGAATAAGLTKEQAEALANQIGLIPAAARTTFETNATGVSAELITLKAQFDAVPGQKQVTVQALTDDAKARLVDMGYTVTTLPDGTIQVTANTDAARANLDAAVAATNSARGTITIDGNKDPATGKTSQAVQFADGSKGTITIDGNNVPANGKTTGSVRFADGSKGTITIDGNQTPANGKINATVTYANGRTGTIQVSANTAPANASISALYARWNGRTIQLGVGAGGGSAGRLAAGGIVQAMNDGGLVGFAGGGTAQRRRLTPMRGGIASIVPPNTWRIVGDRLKDDEAYIPINRSARSQAIFEETARRMGYRVARMYADGGVAAAARATNASVTAARMRQGSGRGDGAAIVAQLAALNARIDTLPSSVTYAPTINNPVAEPPAATKASDLRTAAALRVLR